MGLAPGKLMILLEEQERWGIARLPDHGILQVGPILMRYGTEEQRRHYLPTILACEQVWCQGYSEPNAGSDLASLRTDAVPDGTSSSSTGRRPGPRWRTTPPTCSCWRAPTGSAKSRRASASCCSISNAGHHDAPDPQPRRPRRILRGVLRQRAHTAANLVGELNQGWTDRQVAARLRAHPHRQPAPAAVCAHAACATGAGKRLVRRPRLRRQIYPLRRLDIADLASLYARYVEIVRRGDALGPDVSMLKIWAMETWQRITDLLLETAQENGCMPGDLDIDGVAVDVLSPFYDARPGTDLRRFERNPAQHSREIRAATPLVTRAMPPRAMPWSIPW